MGDVGSAIATPFVAVGTAVTGQANKKIYYDCPRCGEEVWVYAAGAAFVGRKCVDCRGKSGPLDLGVVGDVVDVAVTPITAVGAVVTGNANERIYYNCPKCKQRRWVSAATPHYAGRVCLECKPLGHRAVESMHPMGQAASINDIKKETAQFRGSCVYQQWGERSDRDYSHAINLQDKIVWYETRSCRILHGSVSWAANVMAKTLTVGQADSIQHWWLVIKTRQGHYYQLQFRGLLSNPLTKNWNDDGLIELRKCSSSFDCNQTGLAEADKEPDADVFKEGSYSYTFSSPSYTIGDVVKWMKSHEFSASYNLFSHNCQDLCRKFYVKF